MLVNYFKLKNISKRGKVIALSIVGGVFILLTLFSIWQRNFADTLVRFVPEDTVLYIHFSRPKINSSTKIDQVLTKIFSDMGLSHYDSLDINREAAVIGRLKNNQVEYGLIFKTDRPTRVRKILNESKLKYQSLSYNTFVILSDSWISDFNQNKNNRELLKAKKRFYPLSSINIYATSQFFSNNRDDLNLGVAYLLLKNENNDLILSFKAQGQKLKLFYGGISSVVSSYSKFKLSKIKDTISGDLVFATADFYTLLNNWKTNLGSISSDDYQLFSSSNIGIDLNTYLSSDNRQVFLVARKNNNNSHWLFNDYDFYLSIENIYASKVEEILKNIMAQRYPVVKNTYLSDGTKVSELVPDVEQFSFLEKNGVRYVYSPDGQFKMMYKTVGSVTIISNSELSINQVWPVVDYNYLKFKSDFLSDSGFSGYIRPFEFLEISSGGIILK